MLQEGGSQCHTDICVPNAFSFTIILISVLLVGGSHCHLIALLPVGGVCAMPA